MISGRLPYMSMEKKLKDTFTDIYSMSGYYSETKVLVELTDGRLRYFDPYYVRFMDRSEETNKVDDKAVTKEVIRLKYNKVNKEGD